jgi:DNA-directed RNA polymerase specialized sigma24 family protein
MTNNANTKYSSLIETNKRIIYKIANSFCRDIDVRKDLAQEIIVRLWMSFNTYNEQAKHSTWICLAPHSYIFFPVRESGLQMDHFFNPDKEGA